MFKTLQELTTISETTSVTYPWAKDMAKAAGLKGPFGPEMSDTGDGKFIKKAKSEAAIAGLKQAGYKIHSNEDCDTVHDKDNKKRGMAFQYDEDEPTLAAVRFFDETLAEARTVVEPLRKVKEPGWYVVDHLDRPVEGPMQEGAAKDRAEELSGEVTGDIPAYEASYFTDYQIRRMRMNESAPTKSTGDMDDAEFLAYLKKHKIEGMAAFSARRKRNSLIATKAKEAAECTSDDLKESADSMRAGVVNILMTALHTSDKPTRSALEQAYDAGFKDAGGEINEGLNEGFMDFSVNGSDSAADLHYEALKAVEKKLRVGLRDKGNEYNTHGTLNVAMILVQRYKGELRDDPLHDLAVEVLSKLTAEIKAQEAKDKDNKRVDGDYLRAMKSFAKKLAAATK
jgi:hypothetical protein